MKKILYKNEVAINTDLTKILEARNCFQNIVDQYVAMELPIKLTSSIDLKNLINGGSIWIKERLAEGIATQKILGFSIKGSAAVELMNLPNFQELNETAEVCKPMLHYLLYISFNGKEISLNSGYQGVIAEQHTVWAQNAEQERLLSSHLAAVKALTSFNDCIKAAGLDRLNPDMTLKHYFRFGYSNDFSNASPTLEVEINDTWYRNALHQLVK